MKITRYRLRLWGACYSDQRIAALVPVGGLTPLQIAALNIPVNDRLWVLLHGMIIPEKTLRLLAADWAEAVCLKAGWADERSLNAIAVARRFAVGEATEAELTVARRAASATASTVSASDRHAAQVAMWAADTDTTYAAWAVATAAAASASITETWVSRNNKLDQVLKLIEG